VLAEQNDEWAESRRYMGLEIPAKLRRTGQEPEPTTEPATLIA
jgi:putative transposase